MQSFTATCVADEITELDCVFVPQSYSTDRSNSNQNLRRI